MKKLAHTLTTPSSIFICINYNTHTNSYSENTLCIDGKTSFLNSFNHFWLHNWILRCLKCWRLVSSFDSVVFCFCLFHHFFLIFVISFVVVRVPYSHTLSLLYTQTHTCGDIHRNQCIPIRAPRTKHTLPIDQTTSEAWSMCISQRWTRPLFFGVSTLIFSFRLRIVDIGWRMRLAILLLARCTVLLPLSRRL